MWLKYAVNQDGALVDIKEVASGKTLLKCPYCDGALTAKKGRIKEHHFAHTGETCREVSDRPESDTPTLPLYDKFNLELTGQELEQLKKFWNSVHVTHRVLKRLVSQGLLEKNPYKGRAGGYELTKLGKIPLGELSLMLFNQVQEPLLLKKLVDLQRSVLDAYDADSPSLQERLTDLKLYRTQIRRILSNTLYFLEIQADGETLYKIGVTQRSIEERAAEVQRELRSYYQTVVVKVLGTWEHRGNVELYFKHRYKEFNHPIGSLSEYYKFGDEDALSVLRDLRRMKSKVLTRAEIDIYEGKPDQVEVGIAEDQLAHPIGYKSCAFM